MGRFVNIKTCEMKKIHRGRRAGRSVDVYFYYRGHKQREIVPDNEYFEHWFEINENEQVPHYDDKFSLFTKLFEVRMSWSKMERSTALRVKSLYIHAKRQTLGVVKQQIIKNKFYFFRTEFFDLLEFNKIKNLDIHLVQLNFNKALAQTIYFLNQKD